MPKTASTISISLTEKGARETRYPIPPENIGYTFKAYHSAKPTDNEAAAVRAMAMGIKTRINIRLYLKILCSNFILHTFRF